MDATRFVCLAAQYVSGWAGWLSGLYVIGSHKLWLWYLSTNPTNLILFIFSIKKGFIQINWGCCLCARVCVCGGQGIGHSTDPHTGAVTPDALRLEAVAALATLTLLQLTKITGAGQVAARSYWCSDLGVRRACRCAARVKCIGLVSSIPFVRWRQDPTCTFLIVTK